MMGFIYIYIYTERVGNKGNNEYDESGCKANHEEVEPWEWDEVDCKLAEIRVQLTRKPEATGDTTHGGRNQMVQISKAGSGELESGNKKNTAAEESGHHWDSALFSDRERQEKFNKLMGVKGDVKVEQKPDNQESSSLLQAEKQRELQLDLEKQYTAGLLGSDILRP
ncbi:hypothetical protein CsSME_00003089 [Camellia sinensis var. sinensis]